MKYGTRIFLTSLVIISTLMFSALTLQGLPCVFSARAEDESEYLRIIYDDVPFYNDNTSETPLFFLPYTYYVKVISRGDLFTRVEYGSGGAAIDGYVPTDKLYRDGLSVDAPYPDIKTATAQTTVLYKTAALTSSLQYVFEGRELYLYGKYYSPQGKTLYYVGYNDRLGYVKEEDLVPFTLSNHPNKLTFLPSEPKEEEKPEEQQTAEPAERLSVLRIAIFAVLGLAGVIALVFAANKKPKVSPAASYYDENDYE